jgi:starch phosphorylase
MVMADFEAYFRSQREIDTLWQSKAGWMRTSILNIAHMAWFSADRAISDYAKDIWQVPFGAPDRGIGSVGT